MFSNIFFAKIWPSGYPDARVFLNLIAAAQNLDLGLGLVRILIHRRKFSLEPIPMWRCMCMYRVYLNRVTY